jgi:hypothetical protein
MPDYIVILRELPAGQARQAGSVGDNTFVRNPTVKSFPDEIYRFMWNSTAAQKLTMMQDLNTSITNNGGVAVN